MKKIKSYECDFCGKILKSYSGMWSHEKKCFFNPDSKSCIICKHLESTIAVNGKILTNREHEILTHSVEGTYTNKTCSDGGYDYSYRDLNDEYKYLYEADQVNWCKSKLCILSKLTTNCQMFSVKQDKKNK